MTLDTLINDELAAWDRDCLLHPTTHSAGHARGDLPARIVTGGEGVYVIDRDGNRMLDAFAALYCVNAGYGRSEIADAIAEQARKLAYFHAFAGHGNEPAIRLARMVMDRAPGHMARAYFGLSGSDANETNIKLVWHYNNLLGRPNLPLDGFLHTDAPYFLHRPDAAMSEAEFTDHLIARLIELIEAKGPETIAAFIGEPIMGTGGSSRRRPATGQGCRRSSSATTSS